MLYMYTPSIDNYNDGGDDKNQYGGHDTTNYCTNIGRLGIACLWFRFAE